MCVSVPPPPPRFSSCTSRIEGPSISGIVDEGGWLSAREEELACSPEEREGAERREGKKTRKEKGKERDRDTVRRRRMKRRAEREQKSESTEGKQSEETEIRGKRRMSQQS